jgi:hypothetical protein
MPRRGGMQERCLWLFIRIPGGGRGPGPCPRCGRCVICGQPETVIRDRCPDEVCRNVR